MPDKEKYFKELFQKHIDRLVSYLYFYSHDMELSKNLAQDTFLSFWQHINNVQEDFAVAYLYTSARNKLKSHYRRMIIEEKYSKSAKIRELELKADALEGDTLKWIYHSNLESSYHSALDKMSVKMRETFVLSRMKGKSNKEIAAIEGISEKAVEYRIMVALRILRKHLSDFLVWILMAFAIKWIYM